MHLGTTAHYQMLRQGKTQWNLSMVQGGWDRRTKNSYQGNAHSELLTKDLLTRKILLQESISGEGTDLQPCLHPPFQPVILL